MFELLHVVECKYILLNMNIHVVAFCNIPQTIVESEIYLVAHLNQ